MFTCRNYHRKNFAKWNIDVEKLSLVEISRVKLSRVKYWRVKYSRATFSQAEEFTVEIFTQPPQQQVCIKTKSSIADKRHQVLWYSRCILTPSYHEIQNKTVLKIWYKNMIFESLLTIILEGMQFKKHINSLFLDQKISSENQFGISSKISKNLQKSSKISKNLQKSVSENL